MNLKHLSIAIWVLLPAWAQTTQVEPNAGNWKTWVISSGKDFRVPPPPDAAGTQGELGWLKSFSAERDPRINDQIQYRDAGPPVYRWIDEITNRWINGTAGAQVVPRGYVYAGQAIYDATIAAWESKYFCSRARPSQVDSGVKPRLPVPNSPSYPSEYAATAAAAAEVLAYLLPNEANYFRARAEEAGRSRLYAGLEYPSDYFAGMELGRKVAAARGELLAYLYPDRAAYIQALAKEAGDSGIWAGIHHEIDNVSGVELGRKVARKAIDWASKDGSQ